MITVSQTRNKTACLQEMAKRYHGEIYNFSQTLFIRFFLLILQIYKQNVMQNCQKNWNKKCELMQVVKH